MFFRNIRSKRKKHLAYSLTVICLVLLALIVASSFLIYNHLKLKKALLSTEGFVPMRVERLIAVENYSLVELKNNCSEFSFYVSPQQGYSIERGISNITGYRPLTHDIFVDVLEGFDVRPLLVKITKLSDGTYFAELILQKWNRFLILDTRPSDAIALAVRTGTPIYVNESLVTRTC